MIPLDCFSAYVMREKDVISGSLSQLVRGAEYGWGWMRLNEASNLIFFGDFFFRYREVLEIFCGESLSMMQYLFILLFKFAPLNAPLKFILLLFYFHGLF